MAQRLLLIGWEAADWRILHPLIDSGRMPALARIVENGTSGTLLSGQPLVPAAQWTSFVTGKRPWQHRVCHQFQWDPIAQRAVAAPAAQRHSLPLWEMLAREGKRSLMIGWPATHGARSDRALIVSNRYSEPTAGPGVKPWPPAIAGTYSPNDLGSQLDGLRLSPEDIQVDIISRYVPDWQKLDQKRDHRLGQLRVYLAADFSHHAALMRLLSASEWDFAAVHFPALGAICATFLPFSPPKRDWVSPAEFQMYHQVVDTACVVFDRLLNTLVQAVGQDTTVIVASAHGVNQNLPANYLQTRDNEVWKTPYGILAASGPGFRADSLLLGASIHDATPTILNWFGLPIGDDMEGRALLESFTTSPSVARVVSWESEGQPRMDQDQLAPGGPPSHPIAQRLDLECQRNLALSLLDATRYEQALPLLDELFRSFPERSEFGHTLFQCQLTVGRTTEAAETLGVLLEGIPPGIWSLLPRLELALAQRNWLEARRLVEEVQQLKPTEPEALRRLGMSLWRLREWNALAALARQVLQLDENQPLAWLGLAEASLRQGQPDAAIAAANRALGLNYFQPQAHLVLARAFLSQGKWADARDAIQTVLRLQPGNRAAEVYSRRTGLTER